MMIIVFTSCHDENSPYENTSSKPDLINNDILTISKLGFDTIGVEITDSHYIVEGDILINKEDLRKGTQTKQAYHPNGVIRQDKVVNITIKIDSNIEGTDTGLEWRRAIYRAVTELQSLKGSAVNFSFVSEGDADILIRKYYDNKNTYIVAHGEFPLNGNPGKLIEINYSLPKNLSFSEKVYTMVHEIGHNLGLRHTNWNSIQETSANHIPGTPNSDSKSVMNNGVGEWSGFSNYDKIAICYLYPLTETIGCPPSELSQLINPRFQCSARLIGGNTISLDKPLTVEYSFNYSGSDSFIGKYCYGILIPTSGKGYATYFNMGRIQASLDRKKTCLIHFDYFKDFDYKNGMNISTYKESRFKDEESYKLFFYVSRWMGDRYEHILTPTNISINSKFH